MTFIGLKNIKKFIEQTYFTVLNQKQYKTTKKAEKPEQRKKPNN